MTTTETTAVGAFLLNVGAFIWGAAKLSAAVEHLTGTVKEIKLIVMATQDTVHNLVGRVWVLEDRNDIPHRRITDGHLE